MEIHILSITEKYSLSTINNVTIFIENIYVDKLCFVVRNYLLNVQTS